MSTSTIKKIKINTAEFLLELIDNLNDIWQDEIVKDGTIVPIGAWNTAGFIESRMNDFDETPLLVRISYIGSEFYPATQGFLFELLGSTKVFTFGTFAAKSRSMQEFKQFLSQCIDEIALIPDAESPLNTVIIDAFHGQHIPVADLDAVLNIKNQLLDEKDLDIPMFSFPNPENAHSEPIKDFRPIDISDSIATASDDAKAAFTLADGVVYEHFTKGAVIQIAMVDQKENGGNGFSYTRYYYPKGLDHDYSMDALKSWDNLDTAIAETKLFAAKLTATVRKLKEPDFDVTYYNPKHWRRIDTNDDNHFIFEPTDAGVTLLQDGRVLDTIEFALYCQPLKNND